MKVTREYIHAHASEKGGWNAKQLGALGVSWPPAAGWLDLIAGTELSREQLAEFETARCKKPNPAKKEKPQKPPGKWQLAMEPLKAAGFTTYQSRNNGLHIIFFHGTDARVDYWPTTGLWRRFSDGLKGEGAERWWRF